MSVASLLRLSIIATLIALVLLALYSTFAMWREGVVISKVYQGQVTPINEIARLREYLYAFHLDMEQAATNREGCCRAQQKNLERNLPLIAQNWGALANGDLTAVGERQADLQVLTQGYERFQGLAKSLGQAYENQSPQAVAVLLQQDWPSVQSGFVKPLAELQEALADDVGEAYQNSLSNTQTHAVYLWVLTAFVTIVMGVGAQLVFGRIREPIHELQDAMEKVTSGDLEVQLGLDRKDEIGQIYGYFNEMVKSQKSALYQLEGAQVQLQEEMDVIRSVQDRMSEELDLAGKLQRVFLPDEEFKFAGARGVVSMVTSSEVGGDYYDYFVVSERYIVLVVGDVSGHGVAAGFLVGVAKSTVNDLASQGVRDPAEILKKLNRVLFDMAQQSLFMTMFCTVYDNQEGLLHYANAGHQFPYWRDASAEGKWLALEMGGPPLGSQEDAEYEADILECGPMDRLFIYTDGLVEAEDPQGEPFGYERLEAYLFGYGATALSKGWLVGLFNRVGGHVRSDHHDDDLTMMLVEFGARVPARETQGDDEHEAATVKVITEKEFYSRSTLTSERVSRNLLLFVAEQEIGEILVRLKEDGIRRVLHKYDAFLHRLGWENLLDQHVRSSVNDLMRLSSNAKQHHEWFLTSNGEKERVIDEALHWIQEQAPVPEALFASIPLLLDEMIENALYGAPRAPGNVQRYAKGTPRRLDEGESIAVRVAVEDGQLLAISLEDNWGTLIPRIFLERLQRNSGGNGLQAGVGGAGLYLIWRMSDYLQIRVDPMEKTEVTVLFDLHREPDMERESSFQFFYHLS